MKTKKQLWLLFFVMSQECRSNRSSSKYCEEASEEEESEEEADEKGDAIILSLISSFFMRL